MPAWNSWPGAESAPGIVIFHGPGACSFRNAASSPASRRAWRSFLADDQPAAPCPWSRSRWPASPCGPCHSPRKPWSAEPSVGHETSTRLAIRRAPAGATVFALGEDAECPPRAACPARLSTAASSTARELVERDLRSGVAPHAPAAAQAAAAGCRRGRLEMVRAWMLRRIIGRQQRGVDRESTSVHRAVWTCAGRPRRGALAGGVSTSHNADESSGRRRRSAAGAGSTQQAERQRDADVRAIPEQADARVSVPGRPLHGRLRQLPAGVRSRR